MNRPGWSNPVARRLAACAIAAWAGASGAQAVVYKWVDAAGVTHYAAQPPPGVAATVVRLPPTGDAGPATAVAPPPVPAPSLPAPPGASAAAPAADAARRLRDCARARQQQEALTRGGPVFRYDESGRRVYLEDRDRDAEIARMAALAAQRCAGLTEAQQATAGQAAAAEAAAAARCLAAQETLRELQANARTVAQDLEVARDNVLARCAKAP
jgi:hypothetical protein